jgi:TPR repeat protein
MKFSEAILLALFLLFTISCLLGQPTNSNLDLATSPTYDQLIDKGYSLLKVGRFQEAFFAAVEARKLDDNRFEAYTLAAMSAYESGQASDAKKFIRDAIKRAPPEKTQDLENLSALISNAASIEMTRVSTNQFGLSPDERRRLDALKLIASQADKASSRDERRKLFYEFMHKSAEDLSIDTTPKDVWVLRAAISIELNYPETGWITGRQLLRCGLSNSQDPGIRKVMAELERLHWLDKDSMPQRDWSGWSMSDILQAAQRGDAQACETAGLWFEKGNGILKPDTNYCFSGYDCAANQGFPIAQVKLGDIYKNRSDEAAAIFWYRAAAKQGYADGENSLAWELATTSDDNFRDGKAALIWAKKAVEMTDGKNAGILDTLAAAYAETRDYEKAAITEKVAIDLLVNNNAAQNDFSSRLNLYESNMPFHQTTK